MHAPIHSKAAWRTAELAASGQWLRHLTEAEIAAVASMLQSVAGKPLLELTRADVPLSAFAPVLEELTHELEHGIGFMTIRGLPAARFSAEDNRLLFWAIGTHLCVARPQGKASQLMSDVRAAGGEYRGAWPRPMNSTSTWCWNKATCNS